MSKRNFGFTAPTDAAMFEAWYAAFNLAGYTAAELSEASNWMATTAMLFTSTST